MKQDLQDVQDCQDKRPPALDVSLSCESCSCFDLQDSPTARPPRDEPDLPP